MGKFRQFTSLVPFFSITIPLILGLIMGIWGLLSPLLVIIPKIRERWIVVMVVFTGSLVNTIYNYNPPLATEQKVDIVAVATDRISNYTNCELLNFSLRQNILIQDIENINIGDTISTSVYLEDIDKNNSDTRSIFRSSKRNGIDYVGYTYDNIAIRVGRAESKADIFTHIRAKISEKIASLSTESQNRAILEALLTGDREKLSSKTKIKYRKAGIMHTLAVSGLHVGIIYLILNTIFGFFNIFKLTRIVKIITIIFFLIFYAFICSLTPSVVRAVIMFSAFQLTSFSITSHYHSYNILLFAAFIMIVVDPNVIWNVSFQLSFVAMFGVLFSAAKCDLVKVGGGYIIRKLKNLVIISTFVSFLLLPLLLYYFHESSWLPIIPNIAMTLLLPPLFITTFIYIVYPTYFFDKIIDYLFNAINFMIEKAGNCDLLYISNIEFDLIDLSMCYAAYLIIIYLIATIKNPIPPVLSED